MAASTNMAYLGSDLLVTPFFEADEWQTLDLAKNPLGSTSPGEKVDLAAARGVENLQQALILRLLTPQGSLRDLGHAEYGSRLHELIGEENTEAARLRARSYVLQALDQERRIEHPVSFLDVRPPTADAPNRLRIFITVRAVGGGDPVNLGLEVAF